MRMRDEALHIRKRADILAAAQRCFIETGFHQTGMQDICRAVGMSPGNLYRYFASKDDIIEAMAEQERAENQHFIAQINSAPNVLVGLLSVIAALAPEFTNRANGQLTLDVSAEAARNPRVAEIFEAADREARLALASALKRGQKTGDIRRGLNCAAAAHLLIAILDGLIGRSAFPLPIPRRNLTAALSDLVKRYLAP